MRHDRRPLQALPARHSVVAGGSLGLIGIIARTPSLSPFFVSLFIPFLSLLYVLQNTYVVIYWWYITAVSAPHSSIFWGAYTGTGHSRRWSDGIRLGRNSLDDRHLTTHHRHSHDTRAGPKVLPETLIRHTDDLSLSAHMAFLHHRLGRSWSSFPLVTRQDQKGCFSTGFDFLVRVRTAAVAAFLLAFLLYSATFACPSTGEG
jgi:hypothetical protein